MVFSGLFLTQLSPTQIIVGVFLMSASIWCGIKVSSSREILHPDLLIDLITGKFKVEGNFIFYKFCCTSLLKSHLLFFFRVRQVLCIQHLHCWSFFPQELMCHLSISASLTNSSSQLILVCFYGIVLIFTFVLRCCSVSWVYRSCCSTTGTSAFQEQDFLFFLGYNCQSGLEISEMQSSVSLYSTYMVTSALWKWYKTLFPTLKKNNPKTQDFFFKLFSKRNQKPVWKTWRWSILWQLFPLKDQFDAHTSWRIFLAGIMIIIQQCLWMNGSWSKEPTNGCLEHQKSKRREKMYPYFIKLILYLPVFWMFD